MDQVEIPIGGVQPSYRPRVSRDEMNLAEFPLTVLSTRASPGVKTLEFTDSVRSKNGDLIERKWIITGADKFGLPTASDDEVLLGLLKLTVEDGFRDCKVYFTRYELLRILRWSTEGRSYQRLQRALDRLSGMRIKASNAFFDNESKAHSTRNFGIIDAYEINDGRSNPNSRIKTKLFIWSEVIFKSFQAGFIKKLDLEFYLDLESAVSKRLYRFLDKHFWYRSVVQANLFTLAHEKIGVSRNYKLRELSSSAAGPALEELKLKGFIAGFEYRGRGHGCEITIKSAASKPRKLGTNPNHQHTKDHTKVTIDESSREQNLLLKDQSTHDQAVRNVDFYTQALLDDQGFDDGEAQVAKLKVMLLQRGLNDRQVMGLLADRSPALLERMKDIVVHFDKLVSSGSRLVSRSPIGFLYRAMERPELFVLPGERTPGSAHDQSRIGQQSLSFPVHSPSTPTHMLYRQQHNQQPLKQKTSKAGVGAELVSLEAQYLIERKREARRLVEQVEPDLLHRTTKDVENALQKLRGCISEDRLKEAIGQGVEDRLLKLFAFPEFGEWCRDRRVSKHWQES